MEAVAKLRGAPALGDGRRRVSVRTIGSPVGPLTLVSSTQGLQGVLWSPGPPRSACEDSRSVAILDAAAAQLDEYFAGSRRSFDLPVDLDGTAFQLQAWQALAEIPYGETVTYGEQARRLGRPAAARAVGAANGQNPLSIVLPCHRVVGADGSLTGYGGGLETKRRLLEHELTMLRAAR
jgi:methylated-DNA-[protein]-cysteine S-methyltransferase